MPGITAFNCGAFASQVFAVCSWTDFQEETAHQSWPKGRRGQGECIKLSTLWTGFFSCMKPMGKPPIPEEFRNKPKKRVKRLTIKQPVLSRPVHIGTRLTQHIGEFK
jgi:hypothetical protein